jgi:hypothetical protein
MNNFGPTIRTKDDETGSRMNLPKHPLIQSCSLFASFASFCSNPLLLPSVYYRDPLFAEVFE